MKLKTLQYLICPQCEAELTCSQSADEIFSGQIQCVHCKAKYPILAGVLILVPDVRAYLLEHVKGISRYVDDGEIPKPYRAQYLKCKKELQDEHIEEDLEAERVTALYLMAHYLSAKDIKSENVLIQEVIHKHWDKGPFSVIKKELDQCNERRSLIELGCGTGGLLAALHQNLSQYLGFDQSFASIVLARHFALGLPLNHKTLVPDDLLSGVVSREVKIPKMKLSCEADFIVCDLLNPPVKKEKWQFAAALNVIDMLPDPKALPELQYVLLKKGGVAIQSSPYIWHKIVAEQLRNALPRNIRSSALAAEWLYSSSGFKIDRSHDNVPWIFFKNNRQLEIYSVNLFFASK